MGVPETDPLAQLSLPPGFRFFPTDQELLVQYLCKKVAGHHFSLQLIGEIDLYKFDPWDLPSKAIFGEKEWYFFSPRDRKYPNGSRPNRVAGSGYWKATGTDKVITIDGRIVGIKKALVFYVGKAPKGTKTNWIMHEYRLIEHSRKNGSSKLDDWVLCRIYRKNTSSQKPVSAISTKEYGNISSPSSSSHVDRLDDVLESLPEIDDRVFSLPRMNSLKTLHNYDKLNLQTLSSGNFEWATLAGLSALPEQNHANQAHTDGHGPVNFNNNDTYVPPPSHMNAPPEKFDRSVEEEVQSGLRNPGFFQHNSGLFQSFDQYGFRYPTQPSGYGFRQ